MTAKYRETGFSLIELLVVMGIIALLVGLLVPGLTRAKQLAVKTACAAHLRQVGAAVQMYHDQGGGRYPGARYMPPPFISSDDDPPLPDLLSSYVGDAREVFHCPGDHGHVFDLSGSSYVYNTGLSGRTVDENFLVRRLEFNVTELPVAYDFDGNTFQTTNGPIHVPRFHLTRNLLFADGHVGNYE